MILKTLSLSIILVLIFSYIISEKLVIPLNELAGLFPLVVITFMFSFYQKDLKILKALSVLTAIVILLIITVVINSKFHMSTINNDRLSDMSTVDILNWTAEYSTKKNGFEFYKYVESNDGSKVKVNFIDKEF